VVPIRLLSLFTWKELEVCLCVESFVRRVSCPPPPCPPPYAAAGAGLLWVFSCWQELVGGPPGVDIEVLKRHTVYDGFNASDATIKNFWRVLESFTEEERSM
jgi:hypothetical protein